MLFAVILAIILVITALELTIPYITKIAIDQYIVPDIAPENSISPHSEKSGRRVLACDLSDPAVAKIVADHPNLFEIGKLWRTSPMMPCPACPSAQLPPPQR
ncbi:MAG: hypothetical protein R2874_10095 [Desulfobacterales bacterium]